MADENKLKTHLLAVSAITGRRGFFGGKVAIEFTACGKYIKEYGNPYATDDIREVDCVVCLRSRIMRRIKKLLKK